MLAPSLILVVTAILAEWTYAQTSISPAKCSPTLTASYASPSVATGYVARLVANGLSKPRGLMFDKNGALLVVESGKGITALTIQDNGNGCLSTSKSKSVVSNSALNHGIEMSFDGSTLYASSGDILWSWEYSAQDQATTSQPKTLVQNMQGTDHTTRTPLLSRFAPGLMLLSRGSFENLDPLASDITSGHSQIRAFNISNITSPYNFDTDGKLLGWGLRNDVGMAEEPTQGGIYSVENGADQITRNNQDIHLNNPAEEMNFLGYLNGTSSSNQGRNFGYPTCLTAWQPSEIPAFTGTTGEQFAIGTIDSTNNDTQCSEAVRQQPAIAFEAHMAPIDIKFNPAGTAAWVTFHGSWNRNPPSGYKLSAVAFANGMPTHPPSSMTAALDILSNADNTACPGKCFRPTGLAWDSEGRLFMASDATGEIYAILRRDGKPTNGDVINGTQTSGSGPSASGTSAPSSTSTPSAASHSSVTGVMSMAVLALLSSIWAFLL